MRQLITRALSIDDVQVTTGNEGRTLICRALTYGRPYRVTDDGRSYYNEVWRAGVFAKSLNENSSRIPLMTLHDRGKLPVGVVLDVQDSPSDFIFRSKISATRDGDDALTLINDGVLTGVSVSARILTNRSLPGGVERVEAAIHEISLAPASMTQMPDALVLAVRAIPATEWNEDDEHETTFTIEPTPSLDQARSVIAGLTRP